MRTFLYRLAIFSIAIVGLLGLIIGFLPAFLSTSLGKNLVENYINRRIPGKVEVKFLDLHWGKGQRIEGLVLKDSDGQSVLGFDKFYTDASLWKVLNKSVKLGFTRIKDFNAIFTIDQDGKSNLQHALGISTPTFTPTNSAIITLSDVQGDFYFTAETSVPLSAHLKGITREGNNTGSFVINFVDNYSSNAHENEELDDKLTALNAKNDKHIQVDATIINFPVTILDHLLVINETTPFLRTTIGEKINLNLSQVFSDHELDSIIKLKIESQFLNGEATGKIENEILTLYDHSTFALDVHQSLLAHFSESSIAVQNTSQMHLNIREFQLPLSFLSENLHTTDYNFNIEALITPFQMKIFDTAPLEIKTLKSLLHTTKKDKIIHFSLDSSLLETDHPFGIKVISTLNKPENFSEILTSFYNSAKINFETSDMPLKFFEKRNEKNFLSLLLGRTFNLYAEINNQDQNLSTGWFILKSHGVQIEKSLFKILDKNIELVHPTTINWVIAPTTWNSIFEEERIKLEELVYSKSFVEKFKFSLNDLNKMQLKMNFLAQSIKFNYLDPQFNLVAQNVLVEVEKKEQEMFNTNFAFQILPSSINSNFSTFIDSPLVVKLQSSAKFNAKGKFEIPHLFVEAKSSNIQAKIEGKLTADQIFILNSPFSLDYILTSDAFTKWRQFFNLNHTLQLVNDSTLRLNLNTSPIDLKNNWLSKLVVKGESTFSQLNFRDRANKLISLTDLKLPIELDARHNLLTANLKGSASTNLEPKPNFFYMNLKIEDWLQDDHFDLSFAKAEFSSHFIALPTSLISGLITNHDLSVLIGPSLDIELKTLFDREKQETGYWDMSLDSQSFHAKARLFLGETITLYQSKNPTAIARWTITPEGYEFLKKHYLKNLSLSLLEPFTVTTHLSFLNFPLSLNSSTLKEGKFKAHLATNELKIKNTQPLLPLKFTGELNCESLLQTINFNLRAMTSESDLTINSAVNNLSDETNNFHAMSDMNVNLEVKTNNFPFVYLQALNLLDPKMEETFSTFVGENINLVSLLNTEKKHGTFRTEISGQNGKAKLDGQIKNGVLFLNQPFNYELKIDPLFKKNVLNSRLPFLSSIINAENLVTLEIDPQGFSCPVLPFDEKNLIIEKGVLNAGKIDFVYQGDFKKIASFLLPTVSDRLNIWFTPIYFSYKNDSLAIKRFDMLIANIYELACIGNYYPSINTFDLTIGVQGSTLQKTLGLKDLKDDFIMQFPLKSKDGKIEFDQKNFFTKIAALTAQRQVGEKNSLIGNLLNYVQNDVHEDTFPSPTTYPFPWKSSETNNTAPSQLDTKQQIENSNNKHSSKKKNKKQKKIEVIQENLGNLLKNL